MNHSHAPFLYVLLGKAFAFLCLKNDTKRLMKQQSYDESDIQITKDIPYLDDNDIYHLLDIYEPKGKTKPLPLIFQIHGGGLMYGKKELNYHSNCQLARLGFRVVSLSYRLSPKYQVLDILSDCLAALTWIKGHYSDQNIFFVGDSAGAYLCLLLNAVLKNPEFQTMLGVTVPELNVLAALYVSPMAVLNRSDSLASSGKCAFYGKATQSAFSPYLADIRSGLSAASLSPAVLVTSDKDMIRKDVVSLRDLYQKEGVEHIFLDYASGKGHALEHVFPITYPKYEESQEVFQKAKEFFFSYLKP